MHTIQKFFHIPVDIPNLMDNVDDVNNAGEIKMDESEIEIHDVIDTVIEVLNALTDIAINNVEMIQREEKNLQIIKSRIHLITNLLDARKLRRPVLIARHV